MKQTFNDRVFEDTKIIETEVEKQFLHFWEKGLVSAELSINVPIPLNSGFIKPTNHRLTDPPTI